MSKNRKNNNKKSKRSAGGTTHCLSVKDNTYHSNQACAIVMTRVSLQSPGCHRLQYGFLYTMTTNNTYSTTYKKTKKKTIETYAECLECEGWTLGASLKWWGRLWIEYSCLVITSAQRRRSNHNTDDDDDDARTLNVKMGQLRQIQGNRNHAIFTKLVIYSHHESLS